MGLGVLSVSPVINPTAPSAHPSLLRSSICCVVKIVYLGDLAKGDFTCNLTLLEIGVDDHANGEIDNGVDVIIWGT